MKRQRTDTGKKKKRQIPENCDLVYPFTHKKWAFRNSASNIDPVYPYDKENAVPMPPFIAGGGGIVSDGLELKVNTTQPAAVINDAVTVRYQQPLTTGITGALGVAIDGSSIVLDDQGRLAATGSINGGTTTDNGLLFKVNVSAPAVIKNNAITLDISQPLVVDNDKLALKIDNSTIKVNENGELISTSSSSTGPTNISAVPPIAIDNGSIKIITGKAINSDDGKLNLGFDSRQFAISEDNKLTLSDTLGSRVSVEEPLRIDGGKIHLKADTNQFTTKNGAFSLSDSLESRVAVQPPLKIQNEAVSFLRNENCLYVAQDKLNVNPMLDDGTFVFRRSQVLPGFSNISTQPFYRINSLQITKKGTILAFSDYRAAANDQVAIEPALARSTDGGQTWSYIKPVSRQGSGVSRLMDPTTLYDPDRGRIWLLLGCWTVGNQNWTQNAETANKWKNAKLAWSDNDGETWSNKDFGLAQIKNAPSDCKGFLGGVGAGIVMHGGRLVFPIQWTTGKYDVYPSIIYSDDNGATWTWAAKSPGKNTLTDLKFGSGENMVVEDAKGQLLMLSRFSSQGRKALRTADMGNSWSVDPKYDLKIKEGGECQGSFNLITTKSGCKLLLATAVTNVIGKRSGITLYIFDQDGNAIPVYCINLPISGGYSTLAYMNTTIGEKLMVIYESQNQYVSSDVDSKSQKLKDLTFLLPELENIMKRREISISSTNIDDGKFLFRQGNPIDGFYNISNYPYFRGNTVQITKNGTILAFADYRSKPIGTCAIEPVVARSTDGGVTWTYAKVANRPSDSGADPEVSRLMDPTSLYDPTHNRTWLLLGMWPKGRTGWTASGVTSNNWNGAMLAWSDDDGKTWQSKTLKPTDITGAPTDCKGFLGGVGAGMVSSTGRVIMPIQWTKAKSDVYPSYIYTDDNGEKWTWAEGSPGKGFPLPSGENMVIEEERGVYVMLCRSPTNTESKGKKAFRTVNDGKNWSEYATYDLPTGGNCQGSFNKIVTKSGVSAVIATAVTNLQGDRSGITLFVYQQVGPPVPIYCLNEAVGGGYSCLCYSNSDVGERLLATYECDDYAVDSNINGKSVKIKDLTYLIPTIEKIATGHGDTVTFSDVDGGRFLFRQGRPITGFFHIADYPFFRGNTIQITKKGTILAFADYRSKPIGTCAIEPVVARSTDGGFRWTFSRVADRESGENVDSNVSRLMDPTSLYDPINDKVWLLLGSWPKGTNSWVAPGTTSDNWTGAMLAWSTDDGVTWESKKLTPADIEDSPTGLKGFLGGVGAGTMLKDGTAVLPIQWTKADRKVYQSFIYTQDNGSTWKWAGTASPGSSATFPSGENMIAETGENQLVMLCRGITGNSPNTRRAYKTTDMGKTWTAATEFDLPFGGNCQGAFMKITTKTATDALIATAVTNLVGDRSGITLFVYPRSGAPIPIYCINVAVSGGYSSIAYSNSDIGERLLVTYEFDDDTVSSDVNGKSVKIKDLTFLIPTIEKIATTTSV